jgi:hypothetical protein
MLFDPFGDHVATSSSQAGAGAGVARRMRNGRQREGSER